VYRYQDGYPGLGLAALGILILGSGWEGLRWRRIP
jgi:hypothetical protein